MTKVMPGQRSLNNFYESVKFHDPRLAEDIREDVLLVGLGGLTPDKSATKDAADRLRRVALDLPVIFARVLDKALDDLGY